MAINIRELKEGDLLVWADEIGPNANLRKEHGNGPFKFKLARGGTLTLTRPDEKSIELACFYFKKHQPVALKASS